MLLEELLVEGKFEWVQQNLGDQLMAAARQDHLAKHLHSSKEIIDELVKLDASKGKLKQLQWLANMYIKGSFKLEDSPQVKKAMKDFFLSSQNLEVKDLNRYKTMGEVYKAVAPFSGQTDEEKSVKKLKDVDYLISTPNFKVMIPRTKEAGQLFNNHSSWCTASKDEDKNQFHNYNDQGPIYVIKAKKKYYQIHYESGEFMDKWNDPISDEDIAYLSSFPEYKDFLHMLIDKHYVPHIPKNALKESSHGYSGRSSVRSFSKYAN